MIVIALAVYIALVGVLIGFFIFEMVSHSEPPQ